MHIHCILSDKGSDVATTQPDVTIAEAARMMASQNVGALLVTSADGAVLSIVSERDIARALGRRDNAASTLVSEVMTVEVVTCHPDDSIDSVMASMTNHRIRHLPVLDAHGRLCGIVSIGDIVKWRLDELASEAAAMQEYIAAGR